MSSEQKTPREVTTADPTVVRTKDSHSGTDDIGLSAEIHPDEARRPEEVKSDPAKVKH